MRRFYRDQHVFNVPRPAEHRPQFEEVFKLLDHVNHQRGELGMSTKNIELLILSSKRIDCSKIKWYKNISSYNVPKQMNVHLLTETEYRCLTLMYDSVYPNHKIHDVSKSCWKLSEISLNSFGSSSSRSFQSSYILSYWCGVNGIINGYQSMRLEPRPGRVMFYIKHSVTVNSRIYEHLLACVQWFSPLPENLREYFTKPVQLFYHSLHELNGVAMFMPVQRIKCKFVYAKERIQNKDCLVVLPRDRHLHL